jgi:hypothetical protein
MDQDAKKTALRMIPYGIYVLTADDGKGNVAAATVNWVTQTAFNPPLVVVGVKTDSGAYGIVPSPTGAADRAQRRVCALRTRRASPDAPARFRAGLVHPRRHLHNRRKAL